MEILIVFENYRLSGVALLICCRLRAGVNMNRSESNIKVVLGVKVILNENC